MLRTLVVAALLAAVPGIAAFQASESILHIKVVVTAAGQRTMPVPRHALLISDNPPTATPRRVVTDMDGTANVRLRPGIYTVESDEPFVFEDKSYDWTQLIDIVAGRDAVLELTAANAAVAAISPGSAKSDTPVEVSVSSLLGEWQDSVVALWTPTTHASAFVIDVNGLVATNQRVIGAATSLEIQLTPTVKVAASVVVSDPDKDVAVLRINPALSASVRPVPLGCGDGPKATIAKDQEIVTIGSPLRETKGPRFGTVTRVDPHMLDSDLVIPAGSSGGPVFTSAGSVVGLTSVVDDEDQRRRGTARIVRAEDVCVVVATASAKIKDATPPSDAHLAVEPSRPFPAEALGELAKRRVGSLSPYQMSSTDFDIAFITPVMIYGAQYLAEQANARDRGGAGQPGNPGQVMVSRLLDFGNWSEYVLDTPPVLMVRVTPKLVEGFWTKVARGAAQTQGMSLPPFKRARSGFSKMRAFCGDTEVTPIHPFKIERRVSGTETMYEGLSVFDPGALGPSCGSVKLVVFSEKEPQKGDTRVVDAKAIQQIWDDFAAYRAE
ncbi:MAG TPA: serine protease [Vicinamibacterales bacterium]